jgi:SPP1 gp7 family putative phage head morphogenesis protein
MKRPRRQRETVLRPVHPNAGIAAAYRRKLHVLLSEMAASYAWFLEARWRANPPRMALDATPAKELERELKKLGRRWEKRYAEAAPKLAQWFKQSTAKRSEDALRKILSDAGFSVRFKITPAMRDVLDATVAENVSLIKSIPQEYAKQIEGMVMRSVTAGRDLSSLSKELRSRYGVSKRRAALISRDQNNKATAVMTRVRQQEIGITEAVWLHSGGGKEPRRTHLQNSGKKYKIAEGWFDPDPRVKRSIWPGELINCRCVSKPIVKRFS